MRLRACLAIVAANYRLILFIASIMDTHAIFKNLVNSGLTDKQSEAIVTGMQDSRNMLVTNDKLEAVFERQTRIIILAMTGIVSVLNAVLFVALRFS